MHAKSFQLCLTLVTPWTIAHQATLCRKFSIGIMIIISYILKYIRILYHFSEFILLLFHDAFFFLFFIRIFFHIFVLYFLVCVFKEYVFPYFYFQHFCALNLKCACYKHHKDGLYISNYPKRWKKLLKIEYLGDILPKIA